MARIRTIKPEFWTDGNIVGLSAYARLLYIGTWNFSLCDRGHLPDDPVGLKLKILPADDVDARALLAELLLAGRLIRRRADDGRTYLFNPRLSDHQKVDARWQSRCPHCTSEADSGYVEESPNLPETPASPPEPAETPPSSPQDSKGKDGIGKEVHPSDVQRGKPLDHNRATRIPDNFAPTEEMITWAKENTPHVGTRETAAFVDYWRGIPGTRGRKVDWPATWRNWMRRAETDHHARAPNGRASSPNGSHNGLVERNGLRLRPETAARLDDHARFAAMDTARQQPAIQGPDP